MQQWILVVLAFSPWSLDELCPPTLTDPAQSVFISPYIHSVANCVMHPVFIYWSCIVWKLVGTLAFGLFFPRVKFFLQSRRLWAVGLIHFNLEPSGIHPSWRLGYIDSKSVIQVKTPIDQKRLWAHLRNAKGRMPKSIHFLRIIIFFSSRGLRNCNFSGFSTKNNILTFGEGHYTNKVQNVTGGDFRSLGFSFLPRSKADFNPHFRPWFARTLLAVNRQSRS